MTSAVGVSLDPGIELTALSNEILWSSYWKKRKGYKTDITCNHTSTCAQKITFFQDPCCPALTKSHISNYIR